MAEDTGAGRKRQKLHRTRGRGGWVCVGQTGQEIAACKNDVNYFGTFRNFLNTIYMYIYGLGIFTLNVLSLIWL